MRISTALSGILCLAASAASLAFIAAPASAQVRLYDSTALDPIGDIPIGQYQPVYESFSTDSHTYALVDVNTAFYRSGSPASGTLSINLYGDNGTKPGALIGNIGTLNESIIPATHQGYHGRHTW